MKKLFIFLMVGLLSVALFGCGEKQQDPQKEGKTIYLNYAGTASDKAFNEGLFEDFKAARAAAARGLSPR